MAKFIIRWNAGFGDSHEIIEVDEGDEDDDLFNPQDGARTRRKFFRALTGDGG